MIKTDLDNYFGTEMQLICLRANTPISLQSLHTIYLLKIEKEFGNAN